MSGSRRVVTIGARAHFRSADEANAESLDVLRRKACVHGVFCDGVLERRPPPVISSLKNVKNRDAG